MARFVMFMKLNYSQDWQKCEIVLPLSPGGIILHYNANGVGALLDFKGVINVQPKNYLKFIPFGSLNRGDLRSHLRSEFDLRTGTG